MDDQESADSAQTPHTETDRIWIKRTIEKVKSGFQKYRTQNKQENPQDRASRRTSNATVAIAFLTLAVVAVGGLQYVTFDRQLTAMQGQLNEMVSTGKQTDRMIATNKRLADAADKQAEAAITTAKTAHDTMVANSRAWVGPVNAFLTAQPVADQNLEVTVQYTNTGREPALNLSALIDSFIASGEDDSRGMTMLPILDASVGCFKNIAAVGQVVYPNLGGTSYELKTIVAKEKITPKVVTGDEIVFILGCFSYVTAAATHHSAFCYYYRANRVQIGRLGICNLGHRAD